MAELVSCCKCEREFDSATCILKGENWICLSCLEIEFKKDLLREERKHAESTPRARKTTRDLDKRCKLTEEDIKNIRELVTGGKPIADVATLFGVSRAAVYYWVFPEYRKS